jgi:hypothetical protein
VLHERGGEQQERLSDEQCPIGQAPPQRGGGHAEAHEVEDEPRAGGEPARGEQVEQPAEAHDDEAAADEDRVDAGGAGAREEGGAGAGEGDEGRRGEAPEAVEGHEHRRLRDRRDAGLGAPQPHRHVLFHHQHDGEAAQGVEAEQTGGRHGRSPGYPDGGAG